MMTEKQKEKQPESQSPLRVTLSVNAENID